MQRQNVWMMLAGACIAFAVVRVVVVASEVPGESADKLAAGSLLHSAMNLYHTEGAVRQGGRLAAISRYLERLAPRDLRSQRLLADVDHAQGRLAAAAKAAKKLLDAAPDDYAAGIRWLRFRIVTLNLADERIRVLKEILSEPKYPKPLRAEVATECARIYLAQGDQNRAGELIAQGLELDPLNRSALFSRLELAEKPTIEQEVQTMLSLLRGNPRAWEVARELAGRLGDVGLGELALKYYRHAWALWEGNRPIGEAPAPFAVEYLSALLDAGKADEAVRIFAPSIQRPNHDPEFLSLVIEAYRRTGEQKRFVPLLREVENQYLAQLRGRRIIEKLGKSADEKNAEKKISAEVAMNLGWFYLLVDHRPLRAKQQARKGRDYGADGEAIELLSGAAELTGGQSAGLKRLQPLVKKHSLAAAFLAEYYYSQGDKEAGKKTLLAGFGGKRSGLAYRMLTDLARKHNVAIPPAPDAEAVRKLVDALDQRVLQMGLEPEKFMSVVLKPLQATVELCAPVWVEATVTNIGEIPLSIGQWGLFVPRVGLEVGIVGGIDRTFSSVPVIIWAAPRYLAPSRSVTARTRLDVGPLAKFLANHPLESVELEVRAILSPREVGKKILSGLPSIKPPTTKIRRLGILKSKVDMTPDGYAAALGSLEKLLTDGDEADRMLAARRIAALLSWVRDTEQRRAEVPRLIKPVVKKAALLELMGQTLRDKSPVVRAEMVTALGYADMGEAILNQLGAIIEDPSPLVRFRMVELIGASRTKGSKKLIDLYTRDSDKLVAMMGRAFQRRGKKKSPAAPPVGENHSRNKKR